MTGGADLDKKKTFKQGTQIRLDEEPGGGAFHAEPGKGRKGLESAGRGRPRPRLPPAEEVRGDEAECVGGAGPRRRVTPGGALLPHRGHWAVPGGIFGCQNHEGCVTGIYHMERGCYRTSQTGHPS